MGGSYEYITDTDDELMAVLAIYGGDVLKNIVTKSITPKINTQDSFKIDATAHDGDSVKGMLWRKDNNRPIADMTGAVIGQ